MMAASRPPEDRQKGLVKADFLGSCSPMSWPRRSIRRPVAQRRALLIVADPLLVAGALLLSITIVPLLPLALVPRAVGFQDLFHGISLLSLPLTLASFSLNGCYSTGVLGRWTSCTSRALLALGGVLLGVLMAVYTFQWGEQLSRTVMMLWMPLAALLLVGVRTALFWWQERAMRAGRLGERLVLAGSRRACSEFAAHLASHPHLGLRAVGFACQDLEAATDHSGITCVALTELANLVERVDADRVVVCAGLGDREVIAWSLSELMSSAVPVDMVPDLGDLPVFCVRTDDLAGRPLLMFTGSPLSERARVLKWIEDKVLSLVFLLLAAPVMLVVAIAIKIVSPGPILFVQDRHGIGGRVIRVFKFRTMRHRAGSSTSRIGPPSSRIIRRFQTPLPVVQPDEVRQATAADPRVFPLGRFLRRTSLDELPQFLNVLRGDMSLVGPRPHALGHNEQFSADIADLMRRHFVRPGITGLAQISGARGETRTVEDMRRRISYDLEYIRSWSLWLDLRIIALTVVKGLINRQP